VDPRTGLDMCEKFRPHRDWIPDRPARSQSLYRLNYRAHYKSHIEEEMFYMYMLQIVDSVRNKSSQNYFKILHELL